jgi:UrcA family protein
MGRAVLAGLLGLCATGAMAAGDPELFVSQHSQRDTRSIEVRISDLNLSEARGHRALALRVTRAAKEVCDINGGSELDKLPSAQLCFTDAKDRAFAQLAARGVPATAIAAAGGMI